MSLKNRSNRFCQIWCKTILNFQKYGLQLRMEFFEYFFVENTHSPINEHAFNFVGVDLENISHLCRYETEAEPHVGEFLDEVFFAGG